MIEAKNYSLEFSPRIANRLAGMAAVHNNALYEVSQGGREQTFSESDIENLREKVAKAATEAVDVKGTIDLSSLEIRYLLHLIYEGRELEVASETAKELMKAYVRSSNSADGGKFAKERAFWLEVFGIESDEQ